MVLFVVCSLFVHYLWLSKNSFVYEQGWMSIQMFYPQPIPNQPFITPSLPSPHLRLFSSIGFMGIEDEKRRLLISQNEEAMRASGYSFDDTDTTEWDVEAVVDEDEL